MEIALAFVLSLSGLLGQAEPSAQAPVRKERRLSLTPGRGSQDDLVLSRKERLDRRLLKWPQLTPTQTVDDVMLQRRMQLVEWVHSDSSISSTLAAPIACRSTAVSSDSEIVRA